MRSARGATTCEVADGLCVPPFSDQKRVLNTFVPVVSARNCQLTDRLTPGKTLPSVRVSVVISAGGKTVVTPS